MLIIQKQSRKAKFDMFHYNDIVQIHYEWKRKIDIYKNEVNYMNLMSTNYHKPYVNSETPIAGVTLGNITWPSAIYISLEPLFEEVIINNKKQRKFEVTISKEELKKNYYSVGTDIMAFTSTLLAILGVVYPNTLPYRWMGLKGHD